MVSSVNTITHLGINMGFIYLLTSSPVLFVLAPGFLNVLAVDPHTHALEHLNAHCPLLGVLGSYEMFLLAVTVVEYRERCHMPIVMILPLGGPFPA